MTENAFDIRLTEEQKLKQKELELLLRIKDEVNNLTVRLGNNLPVIFNEVIQKCFSTKDIKLIQELLDIMKVFNDNITSVEGSLIKLAERRIENNGS